ncbi:hypothetical protein AMELA_G00198780 [Ameiurus melas]|uniref:CCHC-type domain-containing protein n=1 Tax=Ameiurus melas TaxID=219545 RepID=A0A7J6A6N4_AMEME|nr:hypothetical protein AMELA_G00198780 [Ameiurus melas]
MSDLPLGCKDHAVKHVLSFRRQVYMFLNNREQMLDVNFKVKHGGNSYTVYNTTERLRCFGCGEVGHKRLSCPHRTAQPESSGGDTAEAQQQQQQRGDSEKKVTGEQEPRAEGGNVSPRSQQEEISKVHTTGATAVPSDSVDARPHTSNDNDTRPRTRNDTDTRPCTSNNNDTRPRTSNDTDTCPRTSNDTDTRPRTSNNNDTCPHTGNDKDTRPRTGNDTGTHDYSSDNTDTTQRSCLKPGKAVTSGERNPTQPQRKYQQDVNVDDKNPKMDRIGKRMEKVKYPSKHNDEMSEDSSSEYSDGSSGEESQPSVFNRPQEPEQLYTEEQIKRFLNVTKGKRNIILTKFFPDRRAFVNSVQHTMGVMSPRRR